MTTTIMARAVRLPEQSDSQSSQTPRAVRLPEQSDSQSSQTPWHSSRKRTHPAPPEWRFDVDQNLRNAIGDAGASRAALRRDAIWSSPGRWLRFVTDQEARKVRHATQRLRQRYAACRAGVIGFGELNASVQGWTFFSASAANARLSRRPRSIPSRGPRVCDRMTK